MAASCAQDGPRWRQDGHLGLNFGGFGAILDVTWTILGGGLGRILEVFWHVAGTVKTFIFLKVFQGFSLFGRLGRACRDILATMLDDIAPKMGTRWMISAKLAILGAILAPRWVPKFFKMRLGSLRRRDDLKNWSGRRWAAVEACPSGG